MRDWYLIFLFFLAMCLGCVIGYKMGLPTEKEKMCLRTYINLMDAHLKLQDQYLFLLTEKAKELKQSPAAK